MEVLAASLNETQKIAEEVAAKLKPGDVIAMYGELGSGKTTFVSMLVKALGFSSRVQSPTFVISRIYENGSSEIKKIQHLDLYRLQKREEVEDLGIDEYLNSENSITLIEWPELAESYLPEKTVRIYFEITGESERKIRVQNLH